MDIVITQWALDSYLDLKNKNVFSSMEYTGIIRPDVLLLKNYPSEPKFNNGKFWSIAEYDSKIIPYGYKMKWHQIGNGKVQLRLPITILKQAFLDAAYVKNDPKTEKRRLAKFKTHIQLIQQGRYTQCGVLT